MAGNETNANEETHAPKQPHGPGMLMVFGLGLLALATWCAYDLFIAEKGEGDATYQTFNYGGLIGGLIGAVYAFVLAAVRSKKGVGGPAPAESPSGSSATEAGPPAETDADEAPEPPETEA